MFEGLHRIYVTQYEDQWQDVVNTVTNIWVSQKEHNFSIDY